MIFQFNSIVGDIEYNRDRIIEGILQAEKKNVDIVIFPELALSGYPPKDNLYFNSFNDRIEDAIGSIMSIVETTCAIFGAPIRDEKGALRNAAIICKNGERIHVYKTLLPDYDVFDETRYFFAAEKPKVVDIKGTTFGIQICEDAWDHLWVHTVPVTQIQTQMGADCIINISASPYRKEKESSRLDLVKNHVNVNSLPFIYVNQVGAQDEIVFDGRSFVVNTHSNLVLSAKRFEEDVRIFTGDLFSKENESETSIYYPDQIEEDIKDAIVLNLRDYLIKSKLPKKLMVALSGGIDSALTCVLGVNAVGKENVSAVYLPTKFSSKKSRTSAKKLAENLGIELLEIDIENLRNEYMDLFGNIKNIDTSFEIAEENIQARIRANIMMYLSNKLKTIVLSTGNKSEIAVGYCTLYGDTAGGKNLIGDLYKDEVYNLARYINRNNKIIPKSIISREPTAELKPNQKDSDFLPPYNILDDILRGLIEDKKSSEELVAEGFEPGIVKKVVSLLIDSEFKRDQIPQSVKLSKTAFGVGRKFPIVNRFYP